MFQKSRPALSNRFQSRASRTSARSSEMPWFTRRTPLSKAAWSVFTASVRQHAHSGSGPCSEWARQLEPRSCDRASCQKRQPLAREKWHVAAHDEVPFDTRTILLQLLCSAVMIPPERSFPGPAILHNPHVSRSPVLGFRARRRSLHVLRYVSQTIERPCAPASASSASSTSALSRPNRVLRLQHIPNSRCSPNLNSADAYVPPSLDP